MDLHIEQIFTIRQLKKWRTWRNVTSLVSL